MNLSGIRRIVAQEWDTLVNIKENNRSWHLSLLAALSVGIPMFIGLLLGNVQQGAFASMGGLVILYYSPAYNIPNRMITLLVCSFGFMVSFAIGAFFSFNAVVAVVVYGLLCMGAYWIASYFNMKAPKGFFFMMLGSIASSFPHNLERLPLQLGLLSLGTMTACTLAFLYSIFIARKKETEWEPIAITIERNYYTSTVEAAIMGGFMAAALAVGFIFSLKNAYWITISCAAVMQGVNLYHIRQRMFHRILGTMLGLGLCWFLLSLNNHPFMVWLIIVICQFLVELFIMRHYALAVFFITPLTMLLAETSRPVFDDVNMLIYTRFWDTVIGSIIGAVGGWFLYNQQLKDVAIRQIRKTKVHLKRKSIY